jgi:processive 1,2-diacylglycerol beta-glucosyltransferase
VLAVGRPALVVQTLPGQEEGNDVYIQSRGAGLSTPNPDSLLQAVRRLVTEPDYRHLMAKRARELGRPDAAFRVGRSLMELMT